MTTAFPLAWPAGWPREKGKMGRGGFISGGSYISFDRAREKLMHELRLLRAKRPVISTNLPLRQDGMPYAGAATKTMQDPGVAVYFVLKERPLAMACDRYTDIAANMRSLGLAIDAMRQLERHGGGVMMERAFSGFAALPPPATARPWREVLEIPNKVMPGIVTRDFVESRFRKLAIERHPDRGGSNDQMAELNAARDSALREVE